MRLVPTIIFLIAAIVLIPIAVFFTGIDLSGFQAGMLRDLFMIMLAVALLCFIVSELALNYSQVDKLWSIMPVIYSAIVMFRSGMQPRIVVMTILVFVWGARLTFNFARRGGYSIKFWQGNEDYRWAVLREMPFLRGRIRWALFNMFFISLYQQTLILLFTLPVLAAMVIDPAPLNRIDGLATLLVIAMVIIETVSDQQQYRYQQEKKRRLTVGSESGEEYERGFVTTGLWKLARHPNYAAEQGVWISFYLFSVAATGKWINWSVTGAVLLVLLFFGSSTFSESISASRYPAYREYMKKVPRFIPGIGRRGSSVRRD